MYSGRKIIEILKKNPEKIPEEYDEDDIPHMRKVAAYCARHLAQEETAKKDPESRSARSLKNWGYVICIQYTLDMLTRQCRHDPAKA